MNKPDDGWPGIGLLLGRGQQRPILRIDDVLEQAKRQDGGYG
jgi:hypothetical protein